MKIGFTGTREGMSQHQKEQFVLKMLELSPSEFHHGDCEGADAEAHDIVRAFFPAVYIVVYPPESSYRQAFKEGDEHKKPAPYLKRDRNIVDNVDYLIAAPLTNKERVRSGTWATIRYAKKIDRDYTRLERENE
jgi:hypothetical protein